ncbi:hypothetical protein AVEN_199758-1 [Araneus ventricosus]|uniref:Uncharacterized protein n=1 Tax=Araneus ventricosus TaxID=182803 RepID=A0A4Y2PSZ5_ARAVE|nr:hypothetical protein AVEN_172557-1 [Araneus ventricosus]GBN54502.1 hypothetical protein AVEN_199758-1 [Araneus ventricosus]
MLKGRSKEVESNVQRKITLLENNVQGKISILKKRIMDLEIRPNNFLECPDVMYARPTVKTLKFYGQTQWTVSKTQLDTWRSVNGWIDRVKAIQLVVSLRGSVMEVLRGIPVDNLTNLTIIYIALESRFENGHITQFYTTELKTRRQKPGENF